jgi:hypothetical protein
MTEEEWLTCGDPERMLAFVLPQASDRRLRLFGCACCRRVYPDMEHEGSRSLTHLIERHADGHAAAAELESAKHVAGDA